MRRTWLLIAIGVLACGEPARDEGVDAGPSDAGDPPDAGDVVDKAAACASTFGNALTDGFGRLDGTIVAIVPPAHPTCAMPNGDHLVVQVSMGGAVYRIVVNVRSDGRDGTDTRLRYAEKSHALPAPDWSEGWHHGVSLEYDRDLGAHNADFRPLEMDALVEAATARLVPGAKVSAYAYTRDRPESAHVVHRDDRYDDGALVVDLDGTPTFLLFHFDGQVF